MTITSNEWANVTNDCKNAVEDSAVFAFIISEPVCST